MNRTALTFATAAVGLAGLSGLAASADAQTAAYWRFEEGPAGDGLNGRRGRPAGAEQDVAAGNTNSNEIGFTEDSADSSGSGNELRTFNAPPVPDTVVNGGNFDTSPVYSSTVPFATVPNTGAANNFSFDFDGSDDVYSLDRNNVAGPINTTDFAAYTVEASFRTPRLGSFQGIVGKDGPTGRAFTDGSGQLLSPQPAFAGPGTQAPAGTREFGYSPFQMKLFGSNFTDFLTDAADGNILDKLAIELVDDSAAGNVNNPSGIHRLVSDSAILADTWYSVALVNDGTTAELYLTDPTTGEYVLQDTESVSGAFAANGNTVWAVGRGFLTRFDFVQVGPNVQRQFRGDLRDSFLGNIDEVRISGAALAPSQFVGAVIPEPASLAVVGLGGLALLRRRR